jgi:hypothetical protein
MSTLPAADARPLWPVYRRHADARCHECGHGLEQTASTPNAAGRGRYRGRCRAAACARLTWYDLRAELPGRVRPTPICSARKSAAHRRRWL